MRDKDGLALSSRNSYLSDDERRIALLLPRAVEKAREYYGAGGRDGRRLLEEIEEGFRDVEGIAIDYIALVKTSDLENTNEIVPGTMLALAARVGATRLIDNHRFTEDPGAD